MNDTRTTSTTGRPPACHYDRTLAQRVTRNHRDDCPTVTNTGDCPATGRGCAPCTAPHCLVCNREHLDNDHPHTCPTCIGKVRDDLTELAHDYADLATEATTGAANGRLAAAAPIPGGNAAVLRGPSVRLDQMRTSRGYRPEHMAEVHPTNKHGRSVDPIPPLAILAQWEDLYRAWFGHTPARRASVDASIRYLTEQLHHMANGPTGGPDWVAFTRSIRTLRSGLERALHDEQEPERGVECFECGDQLVRRFRDPKRCRHTTPARVELQRALVRQRDAQVWLRTLASYPEVPIREEDLAAGRGPSASLVADARRPCAACTQRDGRTGGQGGLDDPRAGRSWECPGCRKDYDTGEYTNAVRRSLLEGDDDVAGWIHIGAAAETVSDVVGMHVTDTLVRKWLDRGKISGVCEWRPGVTWGLRLVFWPDVVAEANAAVERMLAAAEDRRARQAQDTAWRRTVLADLAAGRRLKPAAKRVGKQLRLHPARVAGLLEALEQELAWRAAVSAGERPEVAARRLGIGEDRLSVLLDTVAA